MNFGLFFGILLVLWGVSHIIQTLFNIHIPVFGILFGIFLLYLGLQLLTGCFSYQTSWQCCSKYRGSDTCHSNCMGAAHITTDAQKLSSQEMHLEYNTIMGSSDIDLTHITKDTIPVNKLPLIVHIDTIFGKTEVKINHDTQIRIIAKSAFGHVDLPDGTEIIFGSHTYNSHQNDQPQIIIYTSTLFSATKFKLS